MIPPRGGILRQKRHRYGCARSSSVGAATGTVTYWRASSAPVTRRIAPPLPAASDSLEGEDQRMTGEALVPRQPGQLALVLLEVAPVGLRGKLLRQVEVANQLDVVEHRRWRSGPRDA